MFGLGLQYDTGVNTSVAINASGMVVEVHKAELGNRLWYHVGTIDRNTVAWGASHDYDNGITPSVALNNNRIAVEVHETESPFSNRLYCHVGTVNAESHSITWGPSRDYDDGKVPHVAVNSSGVVVEVHETNSPFDSKMWYHVGHISGDGVVWGPSHDYDTGKTPRVAINSSGLVIEVHEGGKHLWYHVGRLNGDRIDWGPSRYYQSGVQPSVGLTDDGLVIETHKSETFATLWSLVGQVNGDTINWSNASNFDDGVAPSTATNGTWAVQTHQSENFPTLWFSTSLVIDRSNWMGERFDVLKNKTLRQIAIPGTHDAGMYTGNILGRTQDQNLYLQLSGGVRYFDLRPDKNMNIVHGPVNGPPVQEVLNDVNKFMSEGHHELAILKFSHYDGFDDTVYRTLVQMIKDTLGPWLFITSPTTRLAQLSLQEIMGSGPDASAEPSGKLLVLCDGDYPVDIPTRGIYVYRDWESPDPQKGNLTVYDQYSNTINYEQMKQDQLAKFEAFDGKCKYNPAVPCDLFLLSWTLTPPTDVWDASKAANRQLGAVMSGVNRNRNGFITNIIYVDYYEYSRVTDVAVTVNCRW